MGMSIEGNFIRILVGVALLIGLAGCTADRSGVQLAPTAARPCPPWVEFPADIHSNADSIYLGCVNDLNLRSMVENPGDLDHGRTLGPASGTREILGLDAYSQGPKKPSKSDASAVPAIIMPAATGGAAP